MTSKLGHDERNSCGRQSGQVARAALASSKRRYRPVELAHVGAHRHAVRRDLARRVDVIVGRRQLSRGARLRRTLRSRDTQVESTNRQRLHALVLAQQLLVDGRELALDH